MKTESRECGVGRRDAGGTAGGTPALRDSAVLQRLGLSAAAVRRAMGTPAPAAPTVPEPVAAKNKSGRRRRDPREWRLKIRTLREQGLLLREIAARLGLSLAYVAELLPDDLRGKEVPATRHGQGRRYAEGTHPHQLAAQARLVELRQQGLTVRQIAAKTGRSTVWVRQRLPAELRGEQPWSRQELGRQQFAQHRLQWVKA